MLYFIYRDKELLAETDSIDFVKSFVKKHENCSVKNGKTGEEIKVK